MSITPTGERKDARIYFKDKPVILLEHSSLQYSFFQEQQDQQLTKNLGEMIMTSKKDRIFYLLCLLVWFSVACEGCDALVGSIKPTTRSFQGTGTHTWAWNHGEQTCDTDDDMTMTISLESASLRSEGKCMSIQGLNPYTCYESEPGDRCGITITAKYQSKKYVFDSCSNGEQAGGSATYLNDIVSGTATCGNDTFTFSLSEVP